MSTKIDDGGRAFPRPTSVETDDTGTRLDQEGMTLRDYFAAEATDADIAEWIPDTVGESIKLAQRLGTTTKYLRAWARYQHADAMIAERNKETK